MTSNLAVLLHAHHRNSQGTDLRQSGTVTRFRCFPDSVYRFGVDQLIVDQPIANTPCPWKERFQGLPACCAKAMIVTLRIGSSMSLAGTVRLRDGKLCRRSVSLNSALPTHVLARMRQYVMLGLRKYFLKCRAIHLKSVCKARPLLSSNNAELIRSANSCSLEFLAETTLSCAERSKYSIKSTIDSDFSDGRSMLFRSMSSASNVLVKQNGKSW